ncbi:hypothetical protein [Aliiglaciecola litoralis]|uniref:DUF2846 domain-containing protein n=1 Tax=Aliiglaciecola litoralis TaxID=582857 RepID=A0ABP3WZY7_9ALTE
MRTFLVLPIFCCLVLLGCASTVSSIKEDVDIPLSANSGYLLVGVDLNYAVNNIQIGGPKDVLFTRDDLDQFNNYFLVEMPAGKYSFEKIRLLNGYYYTLKSGYWDFEVKPSEISYVGHLKIMSRNGWFSRYNITLENKSTDALEYMQDNYNNILSARRLRHRGPGDDKFLEYVDVELAKEAEQ